MIRMRWGGGMEKEKEKEEEEKKQNMILRKSIGNLNIILQGPATSPR